MGVGPSGPLLPAYSAFDYMRDVVFGIAHGWNNREPFYETLPHAHLAQPFRTVGEHYPARTLQLALLPHLNNTLTQHLTNGGAAFEALLSGEAIRHTFVHGKLAPSAENIEPATLGHIASEYRDGLLDLISERIVAAVADPIRGALYGG
jgi:hypothetical protein